MARYTKICTNENFPLYGTYFNDSKWRHGDAYKWLAYTLWSVQEYQAKYEQQKRVYKDKVDEFMVGLGGKEEQDAYLNSLAEYRAKRRAYLKHFRLKKLGLIKVW